MKVEKENGFTENGEIEEIYKRLRELEAAAVKIDSPEDLEMLEQEIMGLTNHLAALLLQKNSVIH